MNARSWEVCCPVPISPDDERITLAHGEGGRLMRKLIEERILPRLGRSHPAVLEDSARFSPQGTQLAATTDSFVVSPLFFPGGDIGRLAVFGTVNDLAVAGARPRWLTLSLILEEGLPMPLLDRVLDSIAEAARVADVAVIAGDTKVVPRGAADGLFINTAGVGELVAPLLDGPAALRPGDELVVSGPVGRHGIAVLASREELGFEPPPWSDCGPLFWLVDALRQAHLPVRAMRDATRGGVTAVLHEWAEASGMTLAVEESAVPVSAEVRGACELLGLDPLSIPCEGTMLIAVAAGAGESAVGRLGQLSEGEGAAVIGAVRPRGFAPVTVRRILGTELPLDEPSGAALPRIC